MYNNMKKISKSIAVTLFGIMSMAFLQWGCTKDKMSQVKIQIDYSGTGGYYNDNIDAVPSGLIVGENGPYTADPDKTYTLEYKASSNFSVITKQWSPTSGPWKIHCYVEGNIAYMIATPGN
jgi:hypothetical protein